VDQQKPLRKGRTLVGVGPSRKAVVVGAVGPREREPVEASETRRWIFEPKADGEGDESASGVRASETDSLDDGWSEDPPPSPPPSPSGPAEDKTDVAVAAPDAGDTVTLESSDAVSVVDSREAAGAVPPRKAATVDSREAVTATDVRQAVIALNPGDAVRRVDAGEAAGTMDRHEAVTAVNTHDAVTGVDTRDTVVSAVARKAATAPPVPAIAEAKAEPASVEPAPPLTTAEPLPVVPVQIRSRTRWMPVVALLVVAGAAGVWWHRSTERAPVGAETPAIPTASATATAAPTTTTSSAAAAAPAPAPSASPLETAPAPAPSAAAPSPAAAVSFDAKAAKHALDATAKAVANCRRGKTFGTGKATVTFGNDGAVSASVLGAPFAGTPSGACVTEALSGARVAPFHGKPAVVVHRFVVASKRAE
jgi:hypothetical protein